MYRMILWIAIGIVLALVAVNRIPSWPTARSEGMVENCPGMAEPVTRAAARQELERRRRALQGGTTSAADPARLSRRTGEVAEARRAGAVYSATQQLELADSRCILELQKIASGERLRAARGEWVRVTSLILIVSIGLLIALYFGRMAALRRGWFRR